MTDCWEYGFFFHATEIPTFHMYFVCFQQGSSKNNANQIVITPVQEGPKSARKIAYAINPDRVVSDCSELDVLCRIAVADFIEKLTNRIELPSVSRLDFSGRPWDGAALSV